MGRSRMMAFEIQVQCGCQILLKLIYAHKFWWGLANPGARKCCVASFLNLWGKVSLSLTVPAAQWEGEIACKYNMCVFVTILLLSDLVLMSPNIRCILVSFSKAYILPLCVVRGLKNFFLLGRIYRRRCFFCDMAGVFIDPYSGTAA